MGLFDFWSTSKNKDPDEQVLIQLKSAGSDLSKPHNIEFFIYLPTMQAAEKSASQIQSKGFQVKVQKAAEGNEWLCYTTKTMVPDLQTLQKIRTYFNKLIEPLGGEYDGWGTEIEN